MTDDDDIWRRDEVESPCVKICTIHPETRLCIGCHRTAEEIATWSRMAPDRRREVILELPEREPAPKRRTGRARRRRDT